MARSKPVSHVTVLAGALFLLLSAGFLAPASAAPSAPSATSRSLSVAANPTGAVKGKAVTFAGTLTKSPKGSAVSIQRKVGKKWVAAKSTKTSTSTGKYSVRVTVPPKVGTYAYRAFAPAKGKLKAATSKVVKVSTLTPVVATIKASPAPPAAVTAGGKATLTGSAKPFVAGTTVTIQRFANTGKWVNAGATAKLSSKGTFSVQVVVKDGSVFRVSVPRAGLKAPALSGPTAVIVNPVISSTSLPNGVQGNAYTAQLTQVGTNAGTWSVTPALPTGLSLNATTGKITGTPTAQQGATAYTFKFAQPGLVTASKQLNLTITAPVPPTIQTTSLPDADKNQPYSVTLKAVGDPAGTWSAAPLPTGLNLDAGTGVISGTPTATTTNVTVGFTQTNTGLSATPKVLALVVNPPPAPSIRTTSLPNAIQNTGYNFQLQAANGATGTWSVSGSLPVGFSFSTSTGTLSGSSLVVGTYTLTFGFSNADGVADPVTVKLKVVTFAVQANEAIVSAGGSSTCRINPNRSLWCWGADGSGQLGNGGTLTVDPPAQAAPVQVGSATDWTAISVGGDDLPTEAHACGLRGTAAYCWGSNKDGMLGNGVFNGSETAPVAVGGGQAWQSISAGWTHSCGVTTNGKLYCWGDNDFSQLGVAGGDQANPTQVGTATDWESVSGGYTSSCAIKSNGSLYCWGANFRGQLGVGDKDSRATPTKVGNGTWTQVSVGSGYACGRRTTGTLACWGPSSHGQLGNGVNANTPETDVTSPATVGAATSWTSVSAGNGQTCATNLAGEVWCWGYNAFHQVGDGTVTDRAAPVKIGTSTKWVGVSAGATHTCGIQVDGTSNDTFCWGNNAKGKAGSNSSAELNTPTQTVG